MKKKLLSVVLAVVLSLSMAVILTACDETAPHTHTYAEAWSSDVDYHWHAATCEHTDEVSAKAEHAWNSGEVTTMATCDTNGVKTYTCTECGKTKVEDITATGHTHATEWSSDTMHHWHAATCAHAEQIADKAVHNYGADNVCDDCNYTRVTAHVHTYSTEWSKDADYHWHVATCEHTSEISGKAVHNYGADNICDDCEYVDIHVHTFDDDLSRNSTHHWYAATCEHTEEVSDKAEHAYGDDDVCDDCFYVNVNDGYVRFGSYPQSEVTDSGLTMTITSLAGTLPTEDEDYEWTSYGYYEVIDIHLNVPIIGVSNHMWYQDVEYNSEKYRAVYFTSYRPYSTGNTSSIYNSNQDENGYNIDTIYIFKYEPIKWRVLTQENGKAFLLCEMIVDSQEFYIDDSQTRTIDEKTVYANNYKESSIRAWLNDTFYNTAFDALQKQLIETTSVDNSLASTLDSSNSYVCEDTQDKIFLPSAKEVTTSSYGFASNESTSDAVRKKKTTAYAKCQGSWTSTDSSSLGLGTWWLRSPGDGDYAYADGIAQDGVIYSNSGRVKSTNLGVCPALWIRL